MMESLFRNKSLRVRVAALIKDKKGKILLVQQTKKNSSYWLLPGGGIEFGETAEEALHRELKEELSLQVIQSEFLLLNESIDPMKKKHLVQLVFQTKVQELVPTLNPKEKAISGFGYFTPKEILDMDLRPNIKKFFSNKANAQIRYLSSEWVKGL
ncbi:MAG: NUDIX hydrolase [Leptospira sp.]|nr:NUDIX hydrolase [Leptospira sp.]